MTDARPSEDPGALDALGGLAARLVAAHGRLLALACCRPIDGRVELALGVARQLADAGMSVLIVDADHLDPELHAHLGIPAVPGLAQLAEWTAECGEAVHDTEPGVRVLPSGLRAPSSGPIAGGAGTNVAIATAAGGSGVVIILTPPLLAEGCADACRGADSVVLALQKGVARKDETARAAAHVRGSGAVLGGVVIVP